MWRGGEGEAAAAGEEAACCRGVWCCGCGCEGTAAATRAEEVVEATRSELLTLPPAALFVVAAVAVGGTKCCRGGLRGGPSGGVVEGCSGGIDDGEEPLLWCRWC